MTEHNDIYYDIVQSGDYPPILGKNQECKEEKIQARPWVSPEVLFNFGRPELSPRIKLGYFFLYQTSAIFSIMKILDNVCPFSFL